MAFVSGICVFSRKCWVHKFEFSGLEEHEIQPEYENPHTHLAGSVILSRVFMKARCLPCERRLGSLMGGLL